MILMGLVLSGECVPMGRIPIPKELAPHIKAQRRLNSASLSMNAATATPAV